MPPAVALLVGGEYDPTTGIRGSGVVLKSTGNSEYCGAGGGR